MNANENTSSTTAKDSVSTPLANNQEPPKTPTTPEPVKSTQSTQERTETSKPPIDETPAPIVKTVEPAAFIVPKSVKPPAPPPPAPAKAPTPPPPAAPVLVPAPAPILIEPIEPSVAHSVSVQKPKATPEETTNKQDTSNVDLNQLSDELFEDICDEVIKCDDRAPSVPDVILQVISEILAETSPVDEDGQIIEEKQLSDVMNVNKATGGGESLATGVARVISNYPTLVDDAEQQTNIKSNAALVAATVTTTYSNGGGTESIASSASPVARNASSTVSSANEDSYPTQTKESAEAQKLNRNKTRKTITKTFIVDGQTVTQTIKKTVNPEEEERQRKLIEDRKRDLIEHRRNLNEDRRKLIEQTRKQDLEKESLEHDFKEQRDKLLREFEVKLAQIHQFRKSEIERCEEAQAIELKTTLKRLKNEQEKTLKYQRDQLKEEFKLFKKDLESNSNHMLMSKEHRELLKKQKEKELIKRVN